MSPRSDVKKKPALRWRWSVKKTQFDLFEKKVVNFVLRGQITQMKTDTAILTNSEEMTLELKIAEMYKKLQLCADEVYMNFGAGRKWPEKRNFEKHTAANIK